MNQMFHLCAPPHLVKDIISHPSLHLAIIVSRLPPWLSEWPTWALRAFFLLLFAAHAFSSLPLRLLCSTVCVFTGPDPPPFLVGCEGVEFVRATASNLHQALRASTCIPLVSEPVTHLEGAQPGWFCDGALVHFHSSTTISDPAYPCLLLLDVASGGKVKRVRE